MNTGINESNLREIAYRIWESEGRPIGQAERHWLMALDQISADQKTTGDSFLGERINDGVAPLVPDSNDYSFQSELESSDSELDASLPENVQQSFAGHKEKIGKRKKAKAKNEETFADQNASPAPRKNSRKPKTSDNNILV
ncbi:DUF2934 domain-containing protein [Saccharophagus sp. K07]|uniref:DUF2934 domain-containing protein n=1 Tax=Saccharophagus sp. K07 TaxID=2283636 RepID=UPI001651D4B1|nr:DUF2934 domain-containing protein [Saccharophagus sp. K07]MBC6905415.1 DUF2934 domain-containing protein [Saccharophagus sp. K07]